MILNRLPAGTCSAGAALDVFESEDSCSFPDDEVNFDKNMSPKL